nr:uncharacterized protein LOC109155364 [Ipomoea batatas]
MAFASSTIRSKRSATGPPSEQLALLQGGGRGGVPDSGVRRSKRLLSCHDSDQLVGYSGGALVIGKHDVQRVVPSLKGWSTKMLKARESLEITYGGFGLGQLDAPLCQENNRPGVSIGQQLIVGNRSKVGGEKNNSSFSSPRHY